MDRNLYNENNIDDYITNRLPGAERLAFENAMATDPGLAAEVAAQKLLMGAVINFRKQEIKDYIRDNVSENKRRSGIGPMWMSIAAATILAVGAGFYVFLKEQKSGNANKQEMAYDVRKASPKKEEKQKVLTDSVKSGLSKTENVPMPEIAFSMPQKKTEHGPANMDGDMHVVQKTPGLAFKEARMDTTKMTREKVLADKATANPGFYSNNSYSQESKSNAAPPTYQWSTSGNVTSKSNGKMKSSPKANADSIQSDILLLDTTMDILTSEKSGDKFADSRSAAKPKVQIIFWTSSVNFKGYQYYKKKLSLYGVSPKSAIELKKHKGNLYIKMNADVYLINAGNIYSDFSKPIKDALLLKELGY
jgi:hypothetical protein